MSNPDILARFSLSMEQILAQKAKLQQQVDAREKGGSDVDFLYLEDGASAMIRILPLAGGMLSKEVHRYSGLVDGIPGETKKPIASMVPGIVDPCVTIKENLDGQCRKWRNQFKETFGKESDAYKAIEEMTKTIWSESGKLRSSAEHYIVVLHYTAFNTPGVVAGSPQDLGTFSGPKLFRMSEETFGKLLGLMSSPMYSNPPITDFYQGMRIYVSRRGSRKDTTYDLVAEGARTSFPTRPSAANPQQGEFCTDILEKIPDLDVFFKPAPIEELNRLLAIKKYPEMVLSIPVMLQSFYNRWAGIPDTVDFQAAPTPAPSPIAPPQAVPQFAAIPAPPQTQTFTPPPVAPQPAVSAPGGFVVPQAPAPLPAPVAPPPAVAPQPVAAPPAAPVLPPGLVPPTSFTPSVTPPPAPVAAAPAPPPMPPGFTPPAMPAPPGFPAQPAMPLPPAPAQTPPPAPSAPTPPPAAAPTMQVPATPLAAPALPPGMPSPADFLAGLDAKIALAQKKSAV